MTSSENKEDCFLSEHTKAMRQALHVCRQMICSQTKDGLDVAAGGVHDETDQTAASLAINVQKTRQKALQDFTAHLRYDPNFHDANIPNINLDDRDESSSIEAWQFRRDYHQDNLPCRIPGLSKKYFSYVQDHWNSPQKFRKWIQEVFHQVEKQHLPEKDTNDAHLLLPVRRVAAVPCQEEKQQGDKPLDEDGRAHECATIKMTLDEWIAYLDAQTATAKDGSDANIAGLSKDEEKDYLKDWHFEDWLETHHHHYDSILREGDDKTSSTTARPPALYELPNIFEYDLLNPFLRTFTGGDFRFVYWGPAGSRTDWHSDVLHSFSWSYNVYGRKEWTFVVPSDKQQNEPQHNNNNDYNQPPPSPAREIKIIQRAGECVFVPAKWKHQVVNLEETLSINRNWITAANLDLCWDCLLTEIRSIENELAAWKTVEYDWEARESMLRGCVGLDVTAFYLMITYRLAVLAQSHTNTRHDNRGHLAQDLSFEMTRCIATLKELLQDDTVQLAERLQGALASADLANDAIQLGRLLVSRR